MVPGAQLAKFALKNRGGRRIVGRYMEPPDAYRVAESRLGLGVYVHYSSVCEKVRIFILY